MKCSSYICAEGASALMDLSDAVVAGVAQAQLARDHRCFGVTQKRRLVVPATVFDRNESAVGQIQRVP